MTQPTEAALVTYVKGLVFLAPALLFWTAVRAKCVPILLTVSQQFELEYGRGAPLWVFIRFVLDYGFYVLGATAATAILSELCLRAWPRYRRPAVAIAVWLLNLVIICALAALFTLTTIAFPARIQ